MVGPEKGEPLSAAALRAALDYIRSQPEIWEVILTGGDPLVLSARRLRAVMKTLAEIEHVKVVRIHTRVPVADPARMTAELVRAIKVKGKPTYVAVHINHPRELTPAARAACARLADAGIPLLGQSVLLAGVNDTPEVLGESDARLGRMPDQAVLPASRRSGARHRAFAHRYRDRAGVDARLARTIVGPMPADLRARHSRRPRQVADRAELSRARRLEWQDILWSRISTGAGMAIRRRCNGRALVTDRQQIEQRRCHREAGEADEHHCDHRVQNVVRVAPQTPPPQSLLFIMA